MKTILARRSRNFVILIVLAVILITGNALVTVSLHRTTLFSGWLLLFMLVGLSLYNVRKKLAFLPLGLSSSWLQLHIYAGLLTVVVFALHIHWRIPSGIFESILAALYLAVFTSGVIGLLISRLLARRLTARREEVFFERIPRLQNRIRNEVERLVLQCLSETESTAIPEFYTNRLKPYFDGPQNFWGHLLHSDRPRHGLLSELEWQNRYLNETERQYMRQIADRVRFKDDLDYNYAQQATLKYWLFVHIPLTYALLLFAVLHAVLVYAFSGGIR